MVGGGIRGFDGDVGGLLLGFVVRLGGGVRLVVRGGICYGRW